MSGVVKRLLSFLPLAGRRRKGVRYQTLLHSAVQKSTELSVIEFMLDVERADINAQDEKENGTAPL